MVGWGFLRRASASDTTPRRRRSSLGDLVTTLVIGGSSQDTQAWAEQQAQGKAEPLPSDFFGLKARNPGDTDDVEFEKFRGSVCLCVNVASF